MPYLFGFAKLLKQVQITTMVSQPKNQLFYSSENSDLSVALASCIIVLWMVSLIEAFSANVFQTFWFVTLLRILIRTFLHTGIFIVAHEAIHQNFPQHYRLNDIFGRMTSYLYALLSYPVLARNHKLHHCFPGTEKDPDHSEPGGKNFLLWYLKFMKTYQAGGQVWISLTGLSIIFCILVILKVPIVNLILFWLIPMVISSLQLFTFGIFLPHKSRESDPQDGHSTRSLDLPVFLSLVACYHFGYHREHHQYPYLPWYKLPQVYRASKAL